MVTDLRGIRRQNPKQVRTTGAELGGGNVKEGLQVLAYTTEWIMIKKLFFYLILYCKTNPYPQTQLPQFQKRMNPISLKPGLVPKDMFLRLRSFRKHKKTFM